MSRNLPWQAAVLPRPAPTPVPPSPLTRETELPGVGKGSHRDRVCFIKQDKAVNGDPGLTQSWK